MQAVDASPLSAVSKQVIDEEKPDGWTISSMHQSKGDLLKPFAEFIREEIDVENDARWACALVRVLAEVNSNEATLQVLKEATKEEAKVKLSAGQLGKILHVVAPSDHLKKELSSILVTSPVMPFIMTNTTKPPYDLGNLRMSELLFLTITWCPYGRLTDWGKSKTGTAQLVLTIQEALKAYQGLCDSDSSSEGDAVDLYGNAKQCTIMHEVCVKLLIAAQGFCLERGIMDQSWSRKCAFVDAKGTEVVTQYLKASSSQLRWTALITLEGVLCTPDSRGYDKRLQALRSTPELRDILTNLSKSSDDHDSMGARASALCLRFTL